MRHSVDPRQKALFDPGQSMFSPMTIKCMLNDWPAVFQEQCEVVASEVAMQKKVPCEVMQNPSDPEATYDGHKGPGYQAQIAETCSEKNDAQLITGVEVEPAHASDQEALEPMLDQLGRQERQPETLYADAGYGRDENVRAAEGRGVDLQSPVGGTAPQNPEDLTVDDFVIDEQTETVQRCPAGHAPLSSRHDPRAGSTVTVMARETCGWACCSAARAGT